MKFKNITNGHFYFLGFIFLILGISLEGYFRVHDNIFIEGLSVVALIFFLLGFYGVKNLGFVDDLYESYKKTYEDLYNHDSDKKSEDDYKYYKYKENNNNQDQSFEEEILITEDEKFKIYLEFMDLPITATKKEVKAKYREKAKKMHPDKLHNPNKDEIIKATEQMQYLNEAYYYINKAIDNQ